MTDFENEKFFAMSTEGVTITMASALISSISSAIVLNIIRLSPQKLSTTHHRIMAIMSFFDLISSLSMSLVTLPMPANNRYAFSGPMIGNLHTCQAQGFLISFGIGGSGAIFTCLSWYYVFQITCSMNSNKMRRIVEPIMYVSSTLVAVAWPSYFLAQDFLGPDLHYSYCIFTYYIGPNVTEWDEQDTYRFYNVYKNAMNILAIHLGICFSLILVAMIIIIYSIYSSTKDMKNNIEQTTDRVHDHDELRHNTHDPATKWNHLKQSRAVLLQASMYILAYILTWIFSLLFYIKYEYYMDIGTAVLFPLQGLWNMIIFVYDKANLIHQAEGSGSLWGAVRRVICSPSQSPGVVLTDFNAEMLGRKQHETEPEFEIQSKNPLNYQIDPVYDEISLLKDSSNVEQQSNKFSITDSFANREGFLSITSSDKVQDDPRDKHPSTRMPFKRSLSQNR